MRVPDVRGGRVAALSVAIIAGTFAAIVAVAAVAPIDFTGHWTGSAVQQGQSLVTLSADLVSSGKRITGSLVSTQDGQMQTCTLTGKARKTHVKANLGACKVVLHGTFDATTNTISGHFVQHGHHKTHRGTFTLTRSSSPSGAFIDSPLDVR